MSGLRVRVRLVLESTTEHLVFLRDVSSSIHAAAQKMSPWGRRDGRQVTSIRLHKSKTDVLSDTHTQYTFAVYSITQPRATFSLSTVFYIITLHTGLDMNLQQNYKEKNIPKNFLTGHSEGFSSH